MPKEIIHWKVAERTAANLADSELGQALRDHPRSLALGTIFHDILFYMPRPADPALIRLPQLLHGGQGEDTFDILRLQAARVRNEPGNAAARAFLVGLASHVFTDAGLHPFVYHHSGSYETETRAKIRHRLLETVMDLAVLKNRDELKRYRLADVLAGPDAVLERLADLEGLARLGGLDAAVLRSGLDRALARFSRLQTLFCKPLPGRLAFGLRNLQSARMRTLTALFYSPQLGRLAPLLQGPLEYRHPVDGGFARTSLDKLMDQAARNTADFCLALASALDGKAPLDIHGPGPGLASGLPGVGANQGRYYAKDFLLAIQP